MRSSFIAVCCLALPALFAGCSGGPYDSDAWEACRDHVQAEAGIERVSDFDATSAEIGEQGDGWVVQGTVSPDDGPKLQFYCQLDADLSVTDSEVTTA